MINDMKYITLRNLYYRYIKANMYPIYRKHKLDLDIDCLKDTYMGETCFVIGNGPSLKIDDLEKIYENKIPCFAANGIYRLFDETNWRPTFLVYQDQQMIDGLVEKFDYLSQCCEKIFVRRDAYKQVSKEIRDSGKIVYPRLVMHIRKDKYYDFSDDIRKYAVDGCTVTYLMIQLAYYMGFTKIILIGLDHNFPIVFDENDNLIKDETVKMHCFEDESHIILNPARVLETTYAYRSARRFLDSKGIEIYNATRGGKLEEFIRQDIDEILGGQEK